MDRHQLYADFSSRFGQERAAKFLLALHRESVPKKRLYYWQEQMLAVFCAEAGVQIATLEESLDAFNVCHVHGVDLLRDRVPIHYGTRKPQTPGVLEHAKKTYPFANLAAGGPCWVEESTHRTVTFCPGCRAAYLSELEERDGQTPGARP